MNSNSYKILLGKRRGFIVLSIITFFLCLNAADVKLENLTLNQYGLKASGEFFKAATNPALDYVSDDISASAPPYYYKILKAAWLTIKYATCGFSIAILIGICMGVLATKSWWQLQSCSIYSRLTLTLVHRFCKIIITAGRSIHELLWGLIFISAFGMVSLSIVAAIAIPYGCTLAKVYAELLDEQNTRCRDQLHYQGGSSFSSWVFSTLPLAFSDLLSYTFYRYECAIRSAAIFGFVGIQTIGYHIETAAADGPKFYGEIWTLLYALLLIIIFVEIFSSLTRKKLNLPQKAKTDSPKFSELYQSRPKNAYLKCFLIIAASVFFFAWNHESIIPKNNLLSDDTLSSQLTSEQRWKNFKYFLNEELTPSSVRNSGNWSDALPWAKELFFTKGIEASLQTFYIATAAIILAWLSAIFVLPFASRVLSSASPFLIYQGTSRIINGLRSSLASATRFAFIICRAMPEYLLAFLLLIIFQSSAWPLILALAIHNFGIIGRLGGELVDHKEFSHSKLQLSQGASRLGTYYFSLLPSHFNRFLLYFFYRWETCVRDATVLGMLALTSIGFEIQEATARGRIDEMFFFILLGAGIVMIGDMVSDLVRSRLRTV